eukprot:316196-Karenia_brevis.AAC.1
MGHVSMMVLMIMMTTMTLTMSMTMKMTMTMTMVMVRDQVLPPIGTNWYLGGGRGDGASLERAALVT